MSPFLKYRVLLFILALIVSGFSSQSGRPVVAKWIIMKGASLRVDGSTNVNKFNCIVSDHSVPDTLLIHKGSASQVLPVTGMIKLDVREFDCHNPVMTSDLRKTLKAKTYPKLGIRFLNISKYPNLDIRQDVIKGAVVIDLAGVSKAYEVDYKVVSTGADVINLIGSRKVNFTDFNIVPPRKIGGMIQTENELSVVFNLRIKVVQ